MTGIDNNLGLNVHTFAVAETTTWIDPLDNNTIADNASYINSTSHTQQNILVYIPVLFICLCGLILNSLVLSLLQKIKKTSLRPCDVFLTSQLVFDLGFSICAVADTLGVIMRPEYFSDSLGLVILCKVWYSRFTYKIFLVMSVLNSVLLTVERYFKIVFPLRYQSKMTSKKALTVLAVLVGLCLCDSVVGLLYYNVADGECDLKVDRLITVGRMFHNLMAIGIPIFVFIFCYGHILIVLHKRKNMFAPNLHSGLSQTIGSSVEYSPYRQCNTQVAQFSSSSHGAQSQCSSQATVGGSYFEGSSASIRQSTSPEKASDKKNKALASQAERNLLKIAVLVSLTYFGGNGPIWIYGLVVAINTDLNWTTAWIILSLFLYAKYVVNPIIYIFSLRTLRERLK